MIKFQKKIYNQNTLCKKMFKEEIGSNREIITIKIKKIIIRNNNNNSRNMIQYMKTQTLNFNLNNNN